MNWYVEVSILEIYGGNPLPCKEILILSGVSILNDPVSRKVFKVLRSKIGLHRLLGLGAKIACCKNPVSFELLPVILDFCLPADARPPTSGGSCGG